MEPELEATRQVTGDRRRSPRFVPSFGGILSCRGDRLAVVIADLCLHGARIVGAGVCKPRDRVLLELVLPVKLAISAVVVWSTNARRRSAGLVFDDPLSPADLQRLEACHP